MYQQNGLNQTTLINDLNRTNVLSNEMMYTDYNHLPLSDGWSSKNYEYGFSFLPPDKWYPQPPNPPVCVTTNKCPVCPVYTSGSNLDVKEWDNSRRITPPDNIKNNYIADKLNSGK